jgi:hypothetical protein
MATTDEQKTFRTFLNLLAVAHLAIAVIAGFALVLLLMMYGDTAARAANPNRVAELGALATFRPMAMGMALISVITLVGGLISAFCIWRRRSRGFSLFIGVLSLLLFPIGTVIGLTTLVVLAQKPIRALYPPKSS